MVIGTGVERASFPIVCAATAHEGKLARFCGVREDWAGVREFDVLLSDDLEDGFPGEGLGAVIGERLGVVVTVGGVGGLSGCRGGGVSCGRGALSGLCRV